MPAFPTLDLPMLLKFFANSEMMKYTSAVNFIFGPMHFAQL